LELRIRPGREVLTSKKRDRARIRIRARSCVGDVVLRVTTSFGATQNGLLVGCSMVLEADGVSGGAIGKAVSLLPSGNFFGSVTFGRSFGAGTCSGFTMVPE